MKFDVQTAIHLQRKCLGTADYKYLENRLINFILLNIQDKISIQTILYHFKWDESDPNAPSTCSEPGGQQWQHSIWIRRNCILKFYMNIYMMTSSNGNIFHVTGHLCGEFTGPGEFPAQRPVTRSFGVSFDLRLNKRLRKQSWGWWFETLSRPLWRHRNDLS